MYSWNDQLKVIYYLLIYIICLKRYRVKDRWTYEFYWNPYVLLEF